MRTVYSSFCPSSLILTHFYPSCDSSLLAYHFTLIQSLSFSFYHKIFIVKLNSFHGNRTHDRSLLRPTQLSHLCSQNILRKNWKHFGIFPEKTENFHRSWSVGNRSIRRVTSSANRGNEIHQDVSHEDH